MSDDDINDLFLVIDSLRKKYPYDNSWLRNDINTLYNRLLRIIADRVEKRLGTVVT